jgi:predicted phage terminase large subunit-like protein
LGVDCDLPALTSFCAKWRPIRVYIESVGYQLAFVQQAQAKGLPVEPLRRDRGQHKELRVIPLVQACADGRVYLDALAGWLEAFERELLSFPNSGHDDQVDCASDAVTVLSSGMWTPARSTGRSWRYEPPAYLPFRDDPYGVRTGKPLFDPPDGL